ncbi:MAG: cbb3-type cytochrome oxidase assembly protein CcoS [Burkholderiales bacterium]|jgi:cbb3-type cytochrome oxidase maturation protein|nr:cbb3-type cytochrome oxidase assembly protein CcoS [Burkholderiales bacterium]
MEILWLLIPVSVMLVLIIGCIFWWSVRSGQFDDLDGPAYRVLADDDTPVPETAPDAEKAKNNSDATYSG